MIDDHRALGREVWVQGRKLAGDFGLPVGNIVEYESDPRKLRSQAGYEIGHLAEMKVPLASKRGWDGPTRGASWR